MRNARKSRIAHQWKLLCICCILLGIQFSAVAQQIGIGSNRSAPPRDTLPKLPSTTQRLVSEEVEKTFTKKDDGAFHYLSLSGSSTLSVTMGPKKKVIEDYDPKDGESTEFTVKLITHEDTLFLKVSYSRKESVEWKGDNTEFQGIYEMAFQEGNKTDLKEDRRVVLRMKQSDYDRYIADSAAFLAQPGVTAFLEKKAKTEFVAAFNKAMAAKPDTFLPQGMDRTQLEAFKEKIARVTVKATLTFEESPPTITVEGDILKWKTEKQSLNRLFEMSLPSSGN